MASSDINPNFITSAAVSKEATRQQFQNVKDAIATVEARAAVVETGWKRLSTQTIPGTTLEVRCDMSIAYERYRIDWRGLQRTLLDSCSCVCRMTTPRSLRPMIHGIAQDVTSTTTTLNYPLGAASIQLTANTNS